jgi:hypothetical protein
MEINLNQNQPSDSQPIFDQAHREDLPDSFGQLPDSGWSWRKKLIFSGVGLLLFTVALILFLVWKNQPPPTPTSNRVSVTIQGPDQLASGNEAQYVIVYQNGENADLLGLSMDVVYPSNFTFTSAEPAAKTSSGQSFDLPVLREGQQGEIVIRGKLTGKVNESKDIHAKLHYKLSNFNSEFTAEGSFTTVMQAPELTLDITGPIDVTNGQDMTYSLEYANVSGHDFDNVAIQASYPAGFKYSASNPPASKDNNVWNLGKLPVGAKGKIDVQGSFTGDPDQEKLVVASLGQNINNNFAPQITTSVAFKIVPSSLNLVQQASPSDHVKLGDHISYTLNYGNFGTVGMTNAVVVLTLDGAAIDFSNLKADGAIVTGNTLTWKSATLKDLALLPPNKQGKITFTLPIKSALTTNIKNQVIKGSAAIYSDQVTNQIKAQDLEVKISTDLQMLVSAKYVSGARPMQVGQTTTYAVTFILTNLSNDLSDVELIASLPLPSSSWTNMVVPSGEVDKLSLDVNANKIRWKVGDVPAFSGKFTPARTVTFNLQVTPAESDKNTSISLLKDIQVSGTDTFTNETISATTLPDLRTSDADDTDDGLVR